MPEEPGSRLCPAVGVLGMGAEGGNAASLVLAVSFASPRDEQAARSWAITRAKVLGEPTRPAVFPLLVARGQPHLWLCPWDGSVSGFWSVLGAVLPSLLVDESSLVLWGSVPGPARHLAASAAARAR